MLTVQQLRKTYGKGPSEFLAIAEVDLAVADGELVCVVGPSGCGKTTLLKCIAGLSAPDSGRVEVGDVQVAAPHPAMAVVFQEYGRSLFPWLTVQENVDLPLKARRMPKAERRERVVASLSSLGMDGSLDRYPWQLSGGMQQRVAIARALVCAPQILLMDEPFASVDAQTREDLEDLVLRVRREYQTAVLFITHDIDEAVYLADRVVVLSGSPTRVRTVYQVDLPDPRSQGETKALPDFTRLRSAVYHSLRGSQVPADGADVRKGAAHVW